MPVKIGIVSLGLDTYWAQFKDLRQHLDAYRSRIGEKLSGHGVVELVDAGMVDSVDRAHEAARELRSKSVELVFLHVATYALSSTVLPLAQELKLPIVVLNLQPVRQLDYAKFNSLGDRGLMTGVWLEHCQACSCPEIACVFNRAGIDYHLVNGYLDDPAAWREINGWVTAAAVASSLRRDRIGVLGHYYCGMLDVYSDMTALAAVFGCHFELLEMCELASLRRGVDPEELAGKLEEFGNAFKVSGECSQAELERAGLTSCALDKLFASHRLDAMAYYYEGNPESYLDIVTSVIAGNTLLTGRGKPVAGECEIRNVIAMKIMDELKAGGSFAELYLADFADEVIYFGHDGPAHFAIAEGEVELVPVPVYHGKPGSGLSIQMSVKHGEVTLLAVVHGAGGEISLLCAEGESVPGPVLEIGNTNSRYKFSLGAADFLSKWCAAGPAHHCAIGVGRRAADIEKLASLLGIGFKRVC